MAANRKLDLKVPAALLALAFGMATSTNPIFALPAEHAEHMGNQPIGDNWNFGKEVLAAANLDSRVYWNEVNGNPYFFFHGNTDALNKCLELFAATKADGHDVVIVPGSGDTKNFKGDPIPCNWHFNVPSGLYYASGKFSKRARLTVYINQESGNTKVDEKQVQRWIADLDVNDFAAREKAEQELAKLGRAAAPLLRKALEAKPSPETERHIKTLLNKLEGIDLNQIKIPKGLAVLQVSDLLELAHQDLKSTDATVRGMAAGSLGNLDVYGVEVVPELIDILKTDKHEYVRRSAAGALARIGNRASDALPILREGLEDPDVNVRNSFEQTVKMIEDAKVEPNRNEQVKKLKAIQENISRYCKTLSNRAEK